MCFLLVFKSCGKCVGERTTVMKGNLFNPKAFHKEKARVIYVCSSPLSGTPIEC